MLKHSDTRVGRSEVDSNDGTERLVLSPHQGGGQEERGREYGLHECWVAAITRLAVHWLLVAR